MFLPATTTWKYRAFCSSGTAEMPGTGSCINLWVSWKNVKLTWKCFKTFEQIIRENTLVTLSNQPNHCVLTEKYFDWVWNKVTNLLFCITWHLSWIWSRNQRFYFNVRCKMTPRLRKSLETLKYVHFGLKLLILPLQSVLAVLPYFCFNLCRKL